jgi:hypothetical protein
MKKCLLLLAVAAALTVSGPAYSQYFFVDTNGDALNSLNGGVPVPGRPADVLGPTVTTMDVYVVTDKNRDGSDAICNSAELFTINQYEFLLHTSGSGNVTFNTWTDNMGYTVELVLCGDGTICTGGGDVWVGLGSGTQSPPGKYKLGTLGITVTGTPVVSFAPTSSLNANAQSAFGSACDGANFNSLIALYTDFFDSDGTEPTIPVNPTTWGKIKKLYTN